MAPPGIVNLTEAKWGSRPSRLRRGQLYRRAKDFPAPNHRATDRRSIPPLLKLTMPKPRISASRRPHRFRVIVLGPMITIKFRRRTLRAEVAADKTGSGSARG